MERGLTPFVGRERQLRTLLDCFEQASAGQGQVVLLVGDPGIGKSRLLHEFRQRLGDGATWVEGHALSFGRATAFHPLIDLLKRTFRIEEGDPEATISTKIERAVLRLGEDLRPILPHLRYLLAVDPGDPSVGTMDPKQRRAEIFDGVRRLTLRACEVRPQIIVFEDLHWIDQATEEYLRFVADSIPTSRLLLLLTYRPGYVHPLGERTYHTHLTLTPLSAEARMRMTESMLMGAGGLPDELKALVARKAEGNPFFVEEVVKALQEVGAVRRADDRYVLTKPIGEIFVPDTVQDVLMARIDRLADAPKKALQLASVIGREFTRRLLDRLAEFRDRTDEHLRELKAIELIYEKTLFPEPAYLFKHALTHEVAYSSLLVGRRRELHRLIGLAIEELYPDRLAEQYEVLAHHFFRAEEWDKAIDYLLKAAEKATRAFATREALALYDQALEAARGLGDAARPETLMAIYEAKSALYFVVSDFEHSRAEAQELLVIARKVHDNVREGAALAAMAWASTWARDLDHAIIYAREAIEAGGRSDAQPFLARAHFTTGFVRAVTGGLEEADLQIGRALVISQSAGDVVHESLALTVTGLLRSWEGNFAAARLQSRGLAIARERKLLRPLLFSCFLYGITLTGKGDYDDGAALFQEGLTLAEKVGDEAIHHRLLNCLGWLHLELGDVDRATELNRQSAEVGRRRRDPGTLPNTLVNLGEVFMLRGDLALAQEHFDDALRLARDPASSEWMKFRYLIRLYASLGELWLARGDPAKAGALADQCLELATRTNARKNLVKGWRLKGEAALARRRLDEAERALRQALDTARAIGNPPQLWKIHAAWGRLHTEAGRPDLARQAYQAARAVVDPLKAGLRSAELRESLERLSEVRQIYELSAPA
jgi:tetratricopeptide (TPR) repeat protein